MNFHNYDVHNVHNFRDQPVEHGHRQALALLVRHHPVHWALEEPVADCSVRTCCMNRVALEFALPSELPASKSDKTHILSLLLARANY